MKVIPTDNPAAAALPALVETRTMPDRDGGPVRLVPVLVVAGRRCGALPTAWNRWRVVEWHEGDAYMLGHVPGFAEAAAAAKVLPGTSIREGPPIAELVRVGRRWVQQCPRCGHRCPPRNGPDWMDCPRCGPAPAFPPH